MRLVAAALVIGVASGAIVPKDGVAAPSEPSYRACIGEYQQCPATGECVLATANCGQCSSPIAPGSYQCPTSPQTCVALADYATCPGMAGSFWDQTLPLAKRVSLLVTNLTVTEAIAQMTTQAPGIPRLNIPSYNWLNDDLHGLRRHNATSFPNGCGLGATWNNETLYRVGNAIGVEARSLHHWFTERGQRGNSGYKNGLGMTIYGPNINLVKDPRWGRNQEVYGEDPCHAAALAKAIVKGLQEDEGTVPGAEGKLKAAACCKHLAAYDVESFPTLRYMYNAVVDGRNLWETYLPAFETCVREAKAAHVMCSYNAVNGVPACAQGPIMNGILRDRWGFEGFIVSDYDAWAQIQQTHHYCPNMTCAAAVGLNAGLDQEGTGEASTAWAIAQLPEALAQGLVNQSQIYTSATRLFTVRFRLGMFDSPATEQYANVSYGTISGQKDVELALTAAREAMTLHWNKNETLPLKTSALEDDNAILVVGPNAAATFWLEGNYAQSARWGCTSVLEGIMNRACGTGDGTVTSVTLDEPGYTYVRAVPSQLDVVHTVQSVQTLDDCVGLCVADISCNFFTYNQELATCAMLPDSYHRTLVAAADRSVIQSGARPGLCLYSSGVSYVDTSADSYVLAEDHRECCTRCRADSSCDRWTFVGTDFPENYPSNGKCYLNPSSLSPYQDTSAITGTPPYAGTPMRNCSRVKFAPACADRMQCNDPSGFGEVAALAAKAKTVIGVFGLDQSIESEGHDRTTVDLPANQYALANLISSSVQSGTPVVSVFVHGGTFALHQLLNISAAALDAWYPGMQGGTAIAEALFGDLSPAGRSIATYYTDAQQLPPNLAYQQLYANASNHGYMGITYRYFSNTPDLWFGEGVSYTKFAYEWKSWPSSVDRCADLTLQVLVTNTGNALSDVVVPAYVSQSGASQPVPEVRLGAFTRVKRLAPGESTIVTLVIPPKFRAVVIPDPSDIILGTTVAVEANSLSVFVGGTKNPRRGATAFDGVTASISQTGAQTPIDQC